MKDKEKQNISMKEMLTKRSVEPITDCNCKIESRIKSTDKDKIIEEMAKLSRHGNQECCKGDCFGYEFCAVRESCEKLYNAGYRKLPKDSIVLSRQEYERLKTDSLTKSRLTMADRLKIGYKVRKETADQLFTYMDMNNLLEISKTELKAFFGMQHLLEK